MGSASWPASVVSPAREGSYCSSQPITTGEPIISNVERAKGFSSETARGSERRGGIGLSLFALRYRIILIRNRDPGPRECIAKALGVRAGAAGITTPEARYGEPRLELQ